MNTAETRILDQVDQALAHAEPDNDHFLQLLRRSANDIGDAAHIVRGLTLRAGAILNDLNDLDLADEALYDVLYKPDGTLRKVFDPDSLTTVLMCAEAATADELWWQDGDVPTCALGDTQALVRTGYLFVRDMKAQRDQACTPN